MVFSFITSGVYLTDFYTNHQTPPLFLKSFFLFNFFQYASFLHIYDKIWTAFTFSCRPPLQGWTHLRWSPRSLCRTCSSPGCCTCPSLTCSRRWWWNWRTCPTRTSGCSAHQTWSLCRSSARWPLARGCPKCCRWDWEPEWKIRHNSVTLRAVTVKVKTLSWRRANHMNSAKTVYLALLYGDHIREASCYSSTIWKVTILTNEKWFSKTKHVAHSARKLCFYLTWKTLCGSEQSSG